MQLAGLSMLNDVKTRIWTECERYKSGTLRSCIGECVLCDTGMHWFNADVNRIWEAYKDVFATDRKREMSIID